MAAGSIDSRSSGSIEWLVAPFVLWPFVLIFYPVGGVATVLNEFAESSKVAIRIDEAALPLREEVRGLREQQARETSVIVSTNVAAQQQAAGAVVQGVAEATERTAWVQQSQPVIK